MNRDELKTAYRNVEEDLRAQVENGLEVAADVLKLLKFVEETCWEDFPVNTLARIRVDLTGEPGEFEWIGVVSDGWEWVDPHRNTFSFNEYEEEIFYKPENENND